MKSHTFISEVLEIVQDAGKVEGGVDLIVTMGGGSLTDAGKIVALVSCSRCFSPSSIPFPIASSVASFFASPTSPSLLFSSSFAFFLLLLLSLLSYTFRN